MAEKEFKLLITAKNNARKEIDDLQNSINGFNRNLIEQQQKIKTLQKEVQSSQSVLEKTRQKNENEFKKAQAAQTKAIDQVTKAQDNQRYSFLKNITTYEQGINHINALQKRFSDSNKKANSILNTRFLSDAYKQLEFQVGKGANKQHLPFWNAVQYIADNFKGNKQLSKEDLQNYIQRKGIIEKKATKHGLGSITTQNDINNRVEKFLASELKKSNTTQYLTAFKEADEIFKEQKATEDLLNKIKARDKAQEQLTKAREKYNNNLTAFKSQQEEINKKQKEISGENGLKNGLKTNIESLIDSGIFKKESEYIIKKYPFAREINRLNELYKSVIRPAQSYFGLNDINIDLLASNRGDLERELDRKKITDPQQRQSFLNFYDKVIKGVVDERDLLRERANKSKQIQNLISGLSNKDVDIRYLSNQNLKATTSKQLIDKYKSDLNGIEKYKDDTLKILKQYGDKNLSATPSRKEVGRALSSLISSTPLDNAEIDNLRKAVKDYFKANTLSENYSKTIKASEGLIKKQELEAKQQEAQKIRTNTISELTQQTKELKNQFAKIERTPEAQILKSGSKLAPEVFERLGIKKLASDIKSLGKAQIEQFKKYGVNIEWGASDTALLQAVRRARSQGSFNLSDSVQREEVLNLGRNYRNLRDQHTALTGLADVQNRRASAQTTAVADAKKQEKNIQDEINSRNMQLYALSHALKAVEAPIQQAVDISKGNIDEYVKFQSAMVNVAKLMPSLRDKDTLLVNDKFVDFRQKILDLTDALPVSGVSLAQASEEAARLGVTNYNQIKKIIELGAKLGNALGMQPNDVTNQIVKIANAKGIDLNAENSIEQIMDFADAINYLDEHTAASGREIINFTKKAVQTAEGVKMDTKDVSAFGATLVALGISADQANTTFKNFMTVLQTGPRNKQKGYEYFEKSGLKVEEVMKTFKENPTKTAVEFIKRLNKLRNAPAGQDAASIVRFAFGQQASQGLMALVNNPEILEKNLFEAKQNSKGLIEKEFEAKQKNDPAVRFKQLQNRIQKLQIDTGEILMPVADKFIENIKGLADALTPFVKDNSDLIQNTAYMSVGLLGAVKGAGFLVDTATIFNNLRNWKGIQNFGTKWADLSKRSAILNGISTIGTFFGNVGKAITSTPIGKMFGTKNKWWKGLMYSIFGRGALSGLGGLTTGSMLLGIPAAALGGVGIGSAINNAWIDPWLWNSEKSPFFNNRKADKAQTKARGTVKDTQRRNTAQNSSVFLNKKYQDLVERLHSKGYNIDENGQFFRNWKELHLQENEDGSRVLWDVSSPFGHRISESKDPELFGIIDQLQNIRAKIKGARAREGILKEGKGTGYNLFRDRQIEVAENRVKLEQELSAHLGLAYKYGQEGNKLLQHYEELKANEVKGTLKETKDWQIKARQIAEEYGNRDLSDGQWINLLAGVSDTKLKKPEEKKKDKEKKDDYSQNLINNMVGDPLFKETLIGKVIAEQEINKNLDRATELYKSIIAMRDLRKSNQDLYNQEGGDKQYQKYTDWFVGLQATIAKQQGKGTDPNAMNVVLQEITDKWLSNQKAIKESEGQVVKYQEAMKKAEEENKKSIDNTKQQLTDLTQNPWEVKITANTSGVKQAINEVKTQLASLGSGSGGGNKPPKGYNEYTPHLA